MSTQTLAAGTLSDRVTALLARMTRAEKIGQLVLVNGSEGTLPDSLRDEVLAGRVGGVLNEVDPDTVQRLQRLAREQSRLGIPLLIGRDVIHGFHHIAPIPLGLAATWNPALVEACSRISALEASACGVNWALAPMLDIGRDPRWGRVAESFGEDPLLVGEMGAAMVRGLQGADLTRADSLLACLKHFAGYGASEGGRDYNSTQIPEITLRQVHLPPFKACIDAGALSLMASFSELNGVPATANAFLLKQILREEWGFRGFVVSDWEAVGQLVDHGLCADTREAAREAALAGIEMEMYGRCFAEHLDALVTAGSVSEAQLDTMAGHMLEVKLRMGLLDGRPERASVSQSAAELAGPLHRAALESAVLLVNRQQALPLRSEELHTLAVIGPLADEPAEQLGTWVFDGRPELTRTPLRDLRDYAGDRFLVRHEPGLAFSRDRDDAGFEAAVTLAAEADAVVLFLGEEAILSGEAHCRADIRLPGRQEELLRRVCEAGGRVILVLMAGRPLALEAVVELPDAILFAWHPGTLGGPALRELLFGEAVPSGKLPMTFPRVAGQIPIYCAHTNTGRPARPDLYTPMDQIPRGAVQHSTGNTSHYLDAGYTPLFPFGHGLSYTRFDYSDLRLEQSQLSSEQTLRFSVTLRNVGDVAAEEVVQVYVRDLVASVTRPVRELKAFRRVALEPGQSTSVRFEIPIAELAFVGRDHSWCLEPGTHRLWVGGSSTAELEASFEILS
ncbi:MAG: glycoside hydrolase family 3 C-terminal domain-containing protein [Candidatus Cloacimonetes bacterium]|nr:glycoside hydrolase family 3 C-terminal domain-containing protein [Candidatus Cloacimonadota bacterium]